MTTTKSYRLVSVKGEQGKLRHAAEDKLSAYSLCGKPITAVAANAFRPLDASLCPTCRKH